MVPLVPLLISRSTITIYTPLNIYAYIYIYKQKGVSWFWYSWAGFFPFRQVLSVIQENRFRSINILLLFNLSLPVSACICLCLFPSLSRLSVSLCLFAHPLGCRVWVCVWVHGRSGHRKVNPYPLIRSLLHTKRYELKVQCYNRRL